jgi:hypothetical protein
MFVHEKVVVMVLLAFVGSVLITSIVASFIPVDTMSSHADQPDYHFVPFAGDVWGA